MKIRRARVIRRQAQAAAGFPDEADFGGERDFIPLSTPLTQGQASAVVWACVRAASSAVARSRWEVLGADGLPMDGTALLRTVRSRRGGSRYIKWRTATERLLLDGNAYLRILRNGVGQAVGLEAATEGTVRRDGSERVYSLKLLSGERVALRQRDVMAIHGPGYDGETSPSPIRYAARHALGIYQAAQDQQYGSVKRGLHGRAVLVMSADLANVAKANRDDIAKSLEDGYSGARASGKVPVLPPGVQPGTMGGVSPADLQLIELLRWTVEEICRVFGVPPRVVYHYAQRLRVTGFEGQATDWQRHSVEDWCALIGDAATTALLPIDSLFEYRLNSSHLAMGTLGEQVKTLTDGIKGGLWTPNEARRQTGNEPRSDGDGLMLPAGTPGQQATEETA